MKKYIRHIKGEGVSKNTIKRHIPKVLKTGQISRIRGTEGICLCQCSINADEEKVFISKWSITLC